MEQKGHLLPTPAYCSHLGLPEACHSTFASLATNEHTRLVVQGTHHQRAWTENNQLFLFSKTKRF